MKEITSNLNKYFRYFSPRGRRTGIPFHEKASWELSIPLWLICWWSFHGKVGKNNIRWLIDSCWTANEFSIIPCKAANKQQADKRWNGQGVHPREQIHLVIYFLSDMESITSQKRCRRPDENLCLLNLLKVRTQSTWSISKSNSLRKLSRRKVSLVSQQQKVFIRPATA